MGDKNTQFVKCIEKFPCLYNYNDIDYLKKEVSDKAWQEVATETQLTVSECKEKWKNLRYGLLRSLRLNPDGRAKRKYYLHDDMEFILPYISSKQYEMLSPTMDVETDEDKNEQDTDIPLHPQQYQDIEYLEPTRKKSKTSDSNKLYLEKSNECRDDSRKMFILGLMPEINALSNQQMRVFRRKVLALLDEVSDGASENGTWCRSSPSQESQDSFRDYKIKMEPL